MIGRRCFSSIQACFFAFLFVFHCFPISHAYAQCANPPGDAGDMFFNADHAVMQWCDGTNWYAAGGGAGGGGSDTLSGLGCSSGQVASWNGSAWVCTSISDSDTLSGLSCTDGQVASWDNGGSSWICSDISGGGGGTGAGTFRASGGSFSSGSAAVITNLTEDYDPNNVWDEAGSTDQFKPTEAGEYYMYLIGDDTCSANGNGYLQIRLNGATVIGVSSNTGSGNTRIPMSAHTVVSMNGTSDYVEFIGFRTCGGSGSTTSVSAGGFAIGGSGGGGADNLGDHTATQNIDVGNFNIGNVDRVKFRHHTGIPAPLSFGGGGGGGGTPDAFDFTDNTSAQVNSVIASNSINITGLSGIVPVSVSGDGSPQIRIGGGSWVTGGVIANNQSIEVRLTTPDPNETLSVATVDIGGVTDDWNVTTAALGCPNIGDICSDGTIFAGDTNLYSADVDQSTGGVVWSTEDFNTGADSSSDGQANHAWIIANETLSQYPAFELCENLIHNNRADWYLPSRGELTTMYSNINGVGGFTASPYRSSSERDNDQAYGVYFTNGFNYYPQKSEPALRIRCARRQ